MGETPKIRCDHHLATCAHCRKAQAEYEALLAEEARLRGDIEAAKAEAARLSKALKP